MWQMICSNLHIWLEHFFPFNRLLVNIQESVELYSDTKGQLPESPKVPTNTEKPNF